MIDAMKSCAVTALVMLAFAALPAAGQPALPIDRITLPQGFVIETVARVPNARAMTWGDHGTLFVGSTDAGKVYAVTLSGNSPTVRVIASGLREPAGGAFP